MASARVLIADDHPLVVEALSIAARSALPELVADSAGTIAAAEAVARAKPGFRLVLLDLMLPDARGFSGFLRLRHLLPGVAIAIVTAEQRPELIATARMLGAAGYLSKAMPLDDMARAMREILSGRIVFPPHAGFAAAADAARARIAKLSGAQLRVMFAVADGKPNKQVALELGVTEATVKAHLTAIFRSLGVINRTQALLALQPLLSPANARSDDRGNEGAPGS